MSVESYLAENQHMVITCRPEDTVQAAATLLATNKIGALPVLNENNKLVGVISERDIVRAFAMRNYDLTKMLVGELMSRNVVSCTPDDTMTTVRETLKKYGFRHLPVVENEELVGMLSIRDVLQAQLKNAELEASVMRDISIAARTR